jgi:hypothetical protein
VRPTSQISPLGIENSGNLSMTPNTNNNNNFNNGSSYQKNMINNGLSSNQPNVNPFSVSSLNDVANKPLSMDEKDKQNNSILSANKGKPHLTMEKNKLEEEENEEEEDEEGEGDEYEEEEDEEEEHNENHKKGQHPPLNKSDSNKAPNSQGNNSQKALDSKQDPNRQEAALNQSKIFNKPNFEQGSNLLGNSSSKKDESGIIVNNNIDMDKRAEEERQMAEKKLKYDELAVILRRGKVFLKYGYNNLFGPSKRRIYFSSDLRKMFWLKPNTQKILKTFDFGDIVQVLDGRQTDNFKRVSKKKDPVKDSLSFSIVLKDRTIDLQAETQKDKDEFYKSLFELHKMSKSMNIFQPL